MTVRSHRTHLDPRDLPLLAVFAAVARHGSFTAAAHELRLAKSVVSDHVRTLEDRVGVRLLERTTRRVRCTQVGELVHASAERMLAAADEAHRATESHRDAPTGTLRVAATLDLGVRVVAPAVAAVCEQYPALRTELHVSDGEIDLIALGIDVAVRLGVPKSSGFVARKLAVDREIIVASPALADSFRPSRPRDLALAPWLVHERLARLPMRFTGPRSATENLPLPPSRALASNSDALRALARAGIGFLVMPERIVEDELRSGALVHVCEAWHRREIDIYLLMPARRDAPRRVKVLVDELSTRFEEWSSRARPSRRRS